jgi:hypothetical protein
VKPYRRYPPRLEWPRPFALALIGALILALGVASCSAPSASSATSPRARAKAVVCDVFGSRCAAAMRVVACETGGTFDPHAVGDAGERGLFQIHPVHFGRLDAGRLFERRYNALFAYRLSRGGRDWSAWTCKP